MVLFGLFLPLCEIVAFCFPDSGFGKAVFPLHFFAGAPVAVVTVKLNIFCRVNARPVVTLDVRSATPEEQS